MIIVVMVTVPAGKVDVLVQTLLKKRLCACINIINGVESFFWWEGKIDSADESILIIKTKKDLFEKLKEEIEKLHPYTVVEIISWDIDRVNDRYNDWVIDEVDRTD